MIDWWQFVLVPIVALVLAYFLLPEAKGWVDAQLRQKKSAYARISGEGIIVRYQGVEARVVSVSGFGMNRRALLSDGRMVDPFIFDHKDYNTVEPLDGVMPIEHPADAVYIVKEGEDRHRKLSIAYGGNVRAAGDYESEEDSRAKAKKEIADVADPFIRIWGSKQGGKKE